MRRVGGVTARPARLGTVQREQPVAAGFQESSLAGVGQARGSGSIGRGGLGGVVSRGGLRGHGVVLGFSP